MYNCNTDSLGLILVVEVFFSLGHCSGALCIWLSYILSKQVTWDRSWCRCRGSLGTLDGALGSSSFTLPVWGKLYCHIACSLLRFKLLLLRKPWRRQKQKVTHHVRIRSLIVISYLIGLASPFLTIRKSPVARVNLLHRSLIFSQDASMM